MKAIARRAGRTGYAHDVWVRHHHVIADEPEELGGEDAGPGPQELLAASLASCTAITIELYAARKGWDVGAMEVEVDYTPAQSEQATNFHITLRLPPELSDEQLERIEVIAGKCPVHRALAHEVTFDQHTEMLPASSS